MYLNLKVTIGDSCRHNVIYRSPVAENSDDVGDLRKILKVSETSDHAKTPRPGNILIFSVECFESGRATPFVSINTADTAKSGYDEGYGLMGSPYMWM